MRTGYAGRRRANVTRPALIMAMIVVAAVLGAMSSEAAPLTTYYDVSVSTQYENWYGPGYRPDGSLGEPYGIFGGATALHGTGMLSWSPDSASFAFDAGGVYGGFSFDGTSWSPAGGFVPGYVPGPADFRTDWGSIGTGSGSISTNRPKEIYFELVDYWIDCWHPTPTCVSGYLAGSAVILGSARIRTPEPGRDSSVLLFVITGLALLIGRRSTPRRSRA